MSVLASNGSRVVVGVVNGTTTVVDRFTGALRRALPGDWSADALIDGDTVYLVAGATGVVTAFGLVDGLRRPCPSAAWARGVRLWSEGSERGLVVGSYADFFRTFDAEQRFVAEFGLKRRLNAFAVQGTRVVAAYSAGPRRAGPVRAFDCRSGKKLRGQPDGHQGAVLGVHLDAAGLVTSSLDGTVRAYDADLRFVRSATMPAGLYVSRVHGDPRDPGVLHAIGPDAVLRLDRATLTVLEHVPVQSPYVALAVDTVGRLVGVDGGVDSLDGVASPPVDPAVPDVHTSYEQNGFFDKDAQGWCADWTEVAQDGRDVVVREWFDENGSTRSERIRRGRIDRVEGTLVHIAMEDGTTTRFDLPTRRLV